MHANTTSAAAHLGSCNACLLDLGTAALTAWSQVYDAASDPDGDPDVDPFDEKDRAGLAVERYLLRKSRRSAV